MRRRRPSGVFFETIYFIFIINIKILDIVERMTGMRKILGIDTGGTYTDGVIICAEDRTLLSKTKTLTTRSDLYKCIRNCIQAFDPEELQSISLVCLSTTLATNAIVEGRGCREGLILVGGRPEGKMPTEQYRVIQGKSDILGRIRESLDQDEVDEAIESFRGKVDAIAVSGYASVRNPEHELYVKERIGKLLGVPVVCAHELTASLGFYDRTITAALNAKLIPVICNLIDSVKTVMKQYNMGAPLMIVKGDGTLMTEECARDKPIETILSGPAASVIGGTFLSGVKDALILDMGGTTTDIANVTGGKMRLNNEGANVGGWFTSIRAAEIYTVGLGGDSRIYLDSKRDICIGPKKVIPYSMAGLWFHSLNEELKRIYEAEEKPYLNFWRNEHEAFLLLHHFDFSDRTPDERKVLQAVENEPHTMYVLQDECGLGNLRSVLEKLVAEDIIGRIAFTPTDLLHANGMYTQWNRETAEICIGIMAEQLKMSREECIDCVQSTVRQSMCRACINSSFFHDNQTFGEDTEQVADYFINYLFFHDASETLRGSFEIKKPIVAIGAPAKAWVDQIETVLKTQVIIPEHAEVANAVGAAVGQAVQTVEVLICRDPVTKMFHVYSAGGRLSFEELDEATENAKEIGSRLAAAYLPGGEYEVDSQIDDVYTEDRFYGAKKFVERRVTITALSHLIMGKGR